MDGQNVQGAGSGVVATPQQGVPGAPGSPHNEQTVAAQIDWDSDENPLKAKLAEQQAALEAANAERLRIQQAAQHYAAQQAAQQLAEQQRQRDIALENGEMTAAEYKAAIDRERQQERAALEAQLKEVLTPVWAREFAQQEAQRHGLSADEVKELETVAPEAIPFVAQRIARERQMKQTFEERIAQLERSMGAQQIVHNGVTRTATGVTANNAPQQYDQGSLGHLRAALASIGATDLIGH